MRQAEPLVPTVERSMLVPYPSAKMYALILDVDRYPEFLPSCSGARVLQRSEDQVCGEVDLNFKGIRHSFSTCNQLTPYQRIGITLKDGPFSRLDGAWTFHELGQGSSAGETQGCKVSLKLDYDFSSRLLALALGPVFNLFANSLVESFHQRARELYG